MEFEVLVHLVDVGEDILYDSWDDSTQMHVCHNTL